ncbi:MAG: hypothetical protein JXX14_11285, partial [Deltaproteobacteria bacterium]|nr:hypothetical protein [Deltaproteobacteria bacterium]
MLLPSLLQTSLALILAQTAIDTSGCEVFWLDKAGFSTATAVELADGDATGELNGIDVAVTCRKLQATVTVFSRTVGTCPPLVRRISLYDTPEDTRTRTLALTVADAIADYRYGVSTCRWAEVPAVTAEDAGKSARAEQETQSRAKPGTPLNAANAPVRSVAADAQMTRHLSARRHVLDLGALTAFSHP